MPVYYLHICNGSGFTEDNDGHQFADAEAARKGAKKRIRDLMSEELRKGEINVASYIEIEDEDRQLIRIVAFTEAVEVKSDPCPRARAGRRGVKTA